MQKILLIFLFTCSLGLILACSQAADSSPSDTQTPVSANDSTNEIIKQEDADKEGEASTIPPSAEEGLLTESIQPKPETNSNPKPTPVPETSNSEKEIPPLEEKTSPPAPNTVLSAKESVPVKKEVESIPPLSKAPSHAIWDGLLRKYVSPGGKVNYKGMVGEKKLLQSYLDLLATQIPTSDWPRNEKLAYWINAYNAFTVKLILDHYPLSSIMDIDKPWDNSFIQLQGKSYTLNQIENQIIRPRFKEPRIHFAVNCAANSCPPLSNRAFQADKLESQLESMTKKFVTNPASNQLSANKASLSKIFDWYGDDFKQSGSLIDFLNRYAAVKINANAKVTFLEYDWKLNE